MFQEGEIIEVAGQRLLFTTKNRITVGDLNLRYFRFDINSVREYTCNDFIHNFLLGKLPGYQANGVNLDVLGGECAFVIIPPTQSNKWGEVSL